MRKILVAGTLPVLVVLTVALTLTFPVLHAQQDYTSQDAIDLAAAHPAFAKGLEARPGWTGAAYNSRNAYGIWHVQFWDADGEELGWADLSLEHGKVYSWEADYGPTEAQAAEAEAVIRAFLSSNAEIAELVGSLDDVPIYVDYESWRQHWAAYIDLGPDALEVTLRSTTGPPFSLENLQLDQIYFMDMLSYEEWYSTQEARAISLAFQEPEISAALRNYNGWTASSTLDEEGVWHLTFSSGEETLATAEVRVESGQVLQVSSEGP